MSLLVALVVQVVWELVRAVLLETVVSPRSAPLNALEFALTVATALVVVAASIDLGRRLSGARRLGMRIAAGAYVLIAAGVALREGIAFLAHDNAGAVEWVMWMFHYGWRLLDVVAVVGFAMAAGRLGLWLAPPALGLAMAGERPALLSDAWALGIAIALLTARVALMLIMAAAAERHATRPEPARAKAQRGLKLAEVGSWISAVTSITWALPGFSSSSERIAVVMLTMWLTESALFAAGTWALAQARVREVIRWPLCLSVTCVLWGMVRVFRSWSLTLARHWGRWDETHFSTGHWSNAVPDVVACVCTAAVLVVLARRLRSRESLVAAVIYGASLVVVYSVRFSAPEIRPLMAACFVGSNVLAARAFRTARTSLDMGLARARVV